MYPRAYASQLPCFFVHYILKFRCVVLVQDCFIPNYSPTTPLRPTMLRGPTSLLFNQHRGYYPGSKEPGHEANHSPPLIAKVRNSCSYTLHPLCAFTAWTRKISFIPLPRSSMLYHTQQRFHPILYAICAIRTNINLSYTLQKFTRSVFRITF